MHFAEVSVPSVPTNSSPALFHHQSIFPWYSHPFRLKDAHDKEAPTTSYRGEPRCWWRRDFSVHWRPRDDRVTGWRSRTVHGVVHDRWLWWSLLLSRLPSLHFGDRVPHRFRCKVVLSEVTFVSEPPALMLVTVARRTSSGQCACERDVGEEHISRN